MVPRGDGHNVEFDEIAIIQFEFVTYCCWDCYFAATMESDSDSHELAECQTIHSSALENYFEASLNAQGLNLQLAPRP